MREDKSVKGSVVGSPERSRKPSATASTRSIAEPQLNHAASGLANAANRMPSREIERREDAFSVRRVILQEGHR